MKCHTSSFVRIAILLWAPWANILLASDNARHYRDDDLQIEFRLPTGWQKQSCNSEGRASCIELRRTKQRKNSEPAIVIEVQQGNLEKAAGNHVLFEKRGHVWVKQGRDGEREAMAISGSNWKGLEANASCGISDHELGFMPGAGICYTVILSNGIRSAVIETDGFESTIAPFKSITKSFRFIN